VSAPVHPISVREIERILARHIDIETSGSDQSEMQTIVGIPQAAIALADRFLEVFNRYGAKAKGEPDAAT
jgi:hypothetical protein